MQEEKTYTVYLSHEDWGDPVEVTTVEASSPEEACEIARCDISLTAEENK